MLLINALNRINTGTGSSRRLRRLNKIPAILYGKNIKNISIELNHNNILNISNKLNFKQDTITMSLNKKKILVKVKNIQYHVFKKKILHMDFILID
ncbi:50S ribosomal protein L25 [Buchnera aphidicola (Mollitrichosiphum nigrofasciatum)]|uniref:50S ribosomal protein L25 n=1 Tax=Buchnera aphidicola TaxID=9 RepID=UPI0031B82689